MTSTLDRDIDATLRLAPDSTNFLAASLGEHQSGHGYGAIHPSQAYTVGSNGVQHAHSVHNAQVEDNSVDHRGLLCMGVPAIVNGRKAPGAPSRDKKIAYRTRDGLIKFQKPQSVRKACELCHAAKQKCSGDKPRCQRCAASNWDCVYTLRARRSGDDAIASPASSSGTRGRKGSERLTRIPSPSAWGMQPRPATDPARLPPSFPQESSGMYHDLLPPPERWNDAYTYEDHAEESPSPPRTAKRRRIRAETSSKEADKDKDSQTLLTVEEYIDVIKQDGLLSVAELLANVDVLGPVPPPPSPPPKPSTPPPAATVPQANYGDPLINPTALLAALDAIARSADMGDPDPQSAALDARSVQILAQMLDGRLTDGSFMDMTQPQPAAGTEEQYGQMLMSSADGASHSGTNQDAERSLDRTVAVHSALHEALQNTQRCQHESVYPMTGMADSSGKEKQLHQLSQDGVQTHQHFSHFSDLGQQSQQGMHIIQHAGASRMDEQEPTIDEIHNVLARELDSTTEPNTASAYVHDHDYSQQPFNATADADLTRGKANQTSAPAKLCEHVQRLSDIVRLFIEVKLMSTPSLEAVLAPTARGMAVAKDLPQCKECASKPSNTIPLLALLSRLCVTVTKAHPHTPHPLSLVIAGTEIKGTSLAPEIETHIVDVIWNQWRYAFSHQVIDLLESRAAQEIALSRMATSNRSDAGTSGHHAAGPSNEAFSSGTLPNNAGDSEQTLSNADQDLANRTLLEAVAKIRKRLSASKPAVRR